MPMPRPVMRWLVCTTPLAWIRCRKKWKAEMSRHSPAPSTSTGTDCCCKSKEKPRPGRGAIVLFSRLPDARLTEYFRLILRPGKALSGLFLLLLDISSIVKRIYQITVYNMEKETGFTLLELIITLAIVGVLLVIAIPSFKSLRTETRLTALTNELISAYRLARNRAIHSNKRVTLCRSKDGATCYTGQGWNDGWMVFEEFANYAVREPDEIILLVHEPVTGGLTISANAPVKDYISFTPAGYALYKNGGFVAGTITVAAGASFRKIILGSGGRVRIQRNGV
ncbi:MAG: hypothetical protein DSZ32_02655 [Gammaproteobacteria bacterium]|nr:MAG: hypothetical protein DSZ32_02655 [Gammaproteobacteria bacterium]